MVEFDYKELVKATGSFSPSRLLGKGSHGSVYKGILEENQLVAIKKSSNSSGHVSNDNSKKLENEICVLSSLRESPYVINFLGTTHDDHDDSACKEKNRLLVLEFMPNGSLYDLLHADANPPSWSKRVEIAIQIARAIQSLHEGKPLVIHRDIKSANVLFDLDWKASKKLTEICDSRIALPPFMEGTIKHLLYVASRCVSCKEENRPSMSEIVSGMDQNCLAGRSVKIPSWSSLMWSVILMRKAEKVS
ncbi:hypothetical protein OIU85_026952 [Salix viminalis]|uniref:Protein kinase domain-containing protein n=1 Tax=Salix viminalis TaxID=40686 RepID=A0A9Q0TPM5_SALVM|nr:hypothetical protein OIU85_026952 [Salix viminalis]